MTLLPQVRSQLDAAARREAVAHRPLFGWESRRNRSGSARARVAILIRNVPVALSVVTAIVIAVIAVAVLHHGHAVTSPPPNPASASRSPHHPVQIGQPGPVQKAIEAAIGKAARETDQSDRACVNENRGPTTVHGSPGHALLSELGVLRRPELPSSTLQTLLGGGFAAGSRVYLDYIRLAQIAYGRAFYLIPEGNPSGRGSIPARCFTEMRTRLKHLVVELPAGEQATALRQQSQGFMATRLITHRSGLCFAVVTTRHVRPPYGVNSGCSSTMAFLQPGLDGGIGLGDRAGGQIFAAIVPDSVATVTLQFSAGRKYPERTLTARAINNVVVFKIPPHTAHADFPSAIIRRAANGDIVSKTN
jgi:hypothetical protein